MKKVLAVDGNSIINRAYFGVRPLTNGQGQRTEAIYGMMNMILAACDRVSPDKIFCAFDLHAPTFRHGMFDGYKAGRRPMDEELRSQFGPAKELLAAMGCELLSLEGYEADDVLGTIAKRTAEADGECFILTGDRDSLQLISDRTKVLLAGKETLLYDRAAFRAKYGIDPEQFVDAKALMGDSSDNIPGVPGVGEKTALPLIAKFGSLDGVYEHLDDPSIKAGVRQKLAAFKESAYLSQTLSRIVCDVPLAFDFEPKGQTRELGGILTKLGFSSFIARLGVTAETGAEKAEQTVYIDASADELAQKLGKEEKIAVALDGGRLLFSSGAGNFALADADSNDFFLKEFFTPDRKIVVCACREFYAFLASHEICDVSAAGDPELAAYVLSSTDGDYRFPALCLRHLGKTVDRPDAAMTMQLEETLEKKLEEEGSLDLYKEIELPLAKVLFDCETKGVLIDREGVRVFGEALLVHMKKLEEEICALAGHPFNVNSPKQLGQVLFEEKKLVVPGIKKTQSGYSTNAETLENLRYEPIVAAVLDYRQLSKLRSTYTEGLLKVADGQGRVHTKFTQTVTATGRLSSVEPNLQNIPVRTELGRELRRFFIAPEGRVLIDADYSQIELRLLACISGDEAMIGAFRGNEDIHRATASKVFGVPPEEVTAELRKRAKAVNFGIVYGISAFSLSGDLGIARWEADRYIKDYFATYPGVARYLEETVESAKKNGYVTTLFGRRRYIPELTSGKVTLKKFGERVAMNSPIQGTAADVIKKAMIRVDKALRKEAPDAFLILQVHDELIVEASEKDAEKAAAILKREMEGAVDLAVPLTVELNVGKTWFDCK